MRKIGAITESEFRKRRDEIAERCQTFSKSAVTQQATDLFREAAECVGTYTDQALIALGARCIAIGRGCLWTGDVSQCGWKECRDAGECTVKPSQHDYEMAEKLLSRGE